MHKECFVLVVIVFSTIFTGALGQSVCSSTRKANSLYCVPILGVENVTFVPSGGTANFKAPPAFSGLNAAIGTQVSQIPTPSPESGIVFSFGPSGLTGESQLGPIFSQRAATIGKNKLYLAFSYQYFEFDQIDQVRLKQIPLQISGCSPTTSGCVSPFIETASRLDLKVHQFTAYATYGILPRLDVSLSVPFLDVRMGMNTTCTICSQTQPDGSLLAFTPNRAAASSSGIGDLTLRFKGLVWKGERAGLAAGADIRIPSGDEFNYLGTGTAGGGPFAAFSYRGRFSPHANIGYMWNGDSILASTGNSPQHLPNELTYTAGVDVQAIKSIAVVFDFLGETFFSAHRVLLGVRAPLNHPDIACSTSTTSTQCRKETLNTNSFAVGAKFKPAGNFLISANVLFSLDHNGLHHKPAPMVGASYTF
jgi:hypothetical protein